VKQAVQSLLNRVGYRVQGIRYTPRQLLDRQRLRVLEFDDVVCRHMFEHGEALSFLQIGAYDGVSTDPLRRYIERCGWRGVMLEPQPGPAAALRGLYRDYDKVSVIEAALDSQAGTRSLYTVKSDEAPKWVGGMASFDRAHLLKHDYLIPGIERLVTELQVDCVTFEEVLSRLPAGRLDLLQIDAEGADAFILSLFPWERIRPAIVHFEAKNLALTEKESTLEMLGRHGYLVATSGTEDMLAVQIREEREG
jgi:FkbM family methyltransferase